MSLEHIWDVYQREGYASLRQTRPDAACDHFYIALIAFGEDDIPHALHAARQALAHEPRHPVFVAAARYLERVGAHGKTGVYVDGEAFAAFIRGGGNVTLYQAVSEALRAVYEQYETLSLLDIGVGDGLALLPSLTRSFTRVDVVEPSAAMLEQTIASLEAWQVPYRAYRMTIQQFIRGNAPGWDVIQATWCLQSIPPEDRPGLFAWCRDHGQRMLIAEFDVPAWTHLYTPDRVRYIVDRYTVGLAEYAEDGELVAQGFLMPVMFGYFDRSSARTNFEGPIQGWIDGLRAAGFKSIRTHHLSDYWWASTYLIDAR